MKPTLRLLVLLFFAAGVVSAPVGAASEKKDRKDKKELKIVISFAQGPQGYIAGKSAEIWKRMLLYLLDLAKEKSGYKVNFFPQFNWTAAMKAIESKDADMVFLLAPDYVQALAEGSSLKPLIKYTVEGKKTFGVCLYVRADSGIERVGQLKGKTLALEDVNRKALQGKKYASIGAQSAYIQELAMRKLLSKSGEEGKPEAFFSSIQRTVNSEEAMFLAVNGQADAAAANERLFIVLRKADGQFKNLKPIACECSTPYALVAAREDIDTAAYGKLLEFFMKAHTYDGFEEFQDLSGVDRFVEVQDKEFDPLRQLLREAREKGWAVPAPAPKKK